MSAMAPNAFPTRRALLMSALMVAGAGAGYGLRPRFATVAAPPQLGDSVPTEFGRWKEFASNLIQVGLTTGTETTTDQPYDQVVMRRYREPEGGVVMLALAWGGNQRQEVKIHRPDLCYIAQGFQVRSLVPSRCDAVAASSGPVLGKRMVAFNGSRGEAVAYWIRIGRLYSESPLETRLHILREGLAGRISDGVLVRASLPIADAANAGHAFRMAEGFLTELVAATPPAARALLVQ
jgi:EpsI family protein